MIRTNWKKNYLDLRAQHEATLRRLDACRSELARQDAQYQAQGASLDARGATIISMQRRIDDLESECRRMQEHTQDQLAIHSRADLLATVRALSAKGVPCFTRGGVIYHAHTKAILAQMTQGH